MVVTVLRTVLICIVGVKKLMESVRQYVDVKVAKMEK